MKILFKTQKWDKEIIKQKKVREDFAKFSSISMEEHNINLIIEEYCSEKGCTKDLVSLYYLIGDQYYLMAEKDWLLYDDITSCVSHLYLYLLSNKKAYDLMKDGAEIKNQAVKNAMSNGKDFKLLFCSAISLNKFDLLESYSGRCPIISFLYSGNFEYAEKLINLLPDNADDKNEVYYTKDEFLKQIYLSIINKDEVKFNKELILRIKKLRRNMVGYLTILDLISAAMIKIAARQGINYNFDVIEVPRIFIDDFDFDFEKYKLPDIK